MYGDPLATLYIHGFALAFRTCVYISVEAETIAGGRGQPGHGPPKRPKRGLTCLLLPPPQTLVGPFKTGHVQVTGKVVVQLPSRL